MSETLVLLEFNDYGLLTCIDRGTQSAYLLVSWFCIIFTLLYGMHAQDVVPAYGINMHVVLTDLHMSSGNLWL